MSQRSEVELVSKAKCGDVEAFEELIEPYQKKVVAAAYNKTGNMEDAYDIAQEVFVKVFRYIDRFNEQSSFSTWLYKITYNTCMDAMRKKIRRHEGENISIDKKNEDDKNVLELKDERGSPEDKAIKAETRRLVRDAINKLSEEHRQIIVMREMEDLSYDEIAEILDCSLGTVKSRISRARMSLKNILSEFRELFSE